LRKGSLEPDGSFDSEVQNVRTQCQNTNFLEKKIRPLRRGEKRSSARTKRVFRETGERTRCDVRKSGILAVPEERKLQRAMAKDRQVTHLMKDPRGDRKPDRGEEGVGG